MFIAQVHTGGDRDFGYLIADDVEVELAMIYKDLNRYLEGLGL